MNFRDPIVLVPFFIIMFFALRPTIPLENPTTVNLWTFVGAVVVTCVAWLVWRMFFLIYTDQKARAKDGEKS